MINVRYAVQLVVVVPVKRGRESRRDDNIKCLGYKNGMLFFCQAIGAVTNGQINLDWKFFRPLAQGVKRCFQHA